MFKNRRREERNAERWAFDTYLRIVRGDKGFEHYQGWL